MEGDPRPGLPDHTFLPVVFSVIFNNVLLTLSVLVCMIRHIAALARRTGKESQLHLLTLPNYCLPCVLQATCCATTVRTLSHRVLELRWGKAFYKFRSKDSEIRFCLS